MAQCPMCKSEGADILLTKVFCPNHDCQWYDQVVHNRVVESVRVHVERYLNDSDATTSDPDKTPVYHPLMGYPED